MARAALEVADIFRDHGAAWRRANAGHVSLGQLKVMSAIECCRTAALGGHVAACERCEHTQIAYNSCRNRRGPDGKFPVRPYEPGRGTVEGPKWIADAVCKKVEAKYSSARDLNLLVYANFPTNGLDYTSVCTSLSKFAGQFASIWIVTNHLICSVMSFPALGEISDLRMIYDPQELFAL
jgi:hypothetical protein